MDDTLSMAMIEQAQQLPHYSSCGCLIKVMLPFQYIGQGLPLPILNDHIEFMITFEELINFRDGKMIYHLQLMNLFLEHNSLMTSNLVFIDNVDGSCESWFLMNGLSELIKFILFQTRRQHVVLLLNAAFNLLYEVGLLKLNCIFLAIPHHIRCALFSYILCCFWPHICSKGIEI